MADPIHVAAADWFARLQDSEVTVEETLEWQEWMRADTRHRRAFERMDEAWEALRDASPARVEALARRRLVMPFMLAASILVGIGLAFGLYSTFTSSTKLGTLVGENLTETLSDGSQITLGGDSALEYEFTAQERRLKLERGEAYFTVAKDTARPFTVAAGDTRVTAIGTEFNVRRGTDRVVVAVISGRVRVEGSGSVAGHASAQLAAGEQTVVNQQGVAVAAPLANAATAAGWRHGLLSFKREPLRYVLEDVNRYATKRIELVEPEGTVSSAERLGDLQITGTVVSANLQEWISSLEQAFGLTATEEPDRIVLRRK